MAILLMTTANIYTHVHTHTTLTGQTIIIHIYMYQQNRQLFRMAYSLSNVKQDTFVVARILAVRMESLNKKMNYTHTRVNTLHVGMD